MKTKSGVLLIANERAEQIVKHGRTVEKDVKENTFCQLSQFAEILLKSDHEEIYPESFPFEWDRDICSKMIAKPRKERLIIAGALIAAELDRIAAL